MIALSHGEVRYKSVTIILNTTATLPNCGVKKLHEKKRLLVMTKLIYQYLQVIAIENIHVPVTFKLGDARNITLNRVSVQTGFECNSNCTAGSFHKA